METIIPLVPALLTGSSDRPGGSDGPPVRPKPLAPLFGLAPCGVLPATSVARGAVRSYRTFSPLPSFVLRTTEGKPAWACPPQRRGREGGRYIFCATSPSGCPARELPGALSCWSSDFPLPALVPFVRPLLAKKVNSGPVAGSDRLVHYDRTSVSGGGRTIGGRPRPSGSVGRSLRSHRMLTRCASPWAAR